MMFRGLRSTPTENTSEAAAPIAAAAGTTMFDTATTVRRRRRGRLSAKRHDVPRNVGRAQVESRSTIVDAAGMGESSSLYAPADDSAVRSVDQEVDSMFRSMTLVAGLTVVGAAALAAVPTRPTDSTGPTGPTDSTVPNGPVAPGIALERCIVRLHGASGGGQPTAVWGGVADVMPNGNGELAAGGLLWDYDEDADYDAARAIVEEAVEPCEAIILDGFSNGAAFAATMLCRGETFDGRLQRVVIDDPVTDGGVADCAPEPSVDVVLYWTGALDDTSLPGTDCRDAEFVCLGGTMLGIEAYAEALGVEPLPSVHTEHAWYWNAPELADWREPTVSPDVPRTTGGTDSSPRAVCVSVMTPLVIRGVVTTGASWASGDSEGLSRCVTSGGLDAASLLRSRQARRPQRSYGTVRRRTGRFALSAASARWR